MSKREKRLQKIRQNPNNVSIDELAQVLKDYGIEYDHATRTPQKSLWIAERRGGINPARFSLIYTILALSQLRIQSLKTIVVDYYW